MVDQRTVHHDRSRQNSSPLKFKSLVRRQHGIDRCCRPHMHDNQSLARIKRRCSNSSVPPVAAKLAIIFIAVAQLKRTIKHLLGVHPLPLNAVLIEKFRQSQRQIFTGNHAANDMFWL